MTYSEIQLVLERKMAAWPGAIPVWFDGIPIPPHVKDARDGSPRGPWMRFVITLAPARAGEIAKKPGRIVPGNIAMEIYYPRVTSGIPGKPGINPAFECTKLADELAEHFEFIQEGHLTTYATSNVYVEPEESWYRRNVVTDFDAGC